MDVIHKYKRVKHAWVHAGTHAGTHVRDLPAGIRVSSPAGKRAVPVIRVLKHATHAGIHALHVIRVKPSRASPHAERHAGTHASPVNTPAGLPVVKHAGTRVSRHANGIHA